MNSKSLLRYYIDAFRLHFFDYAGRARRREFWGFALFDSLIAVVLLSIGYMLFLPHEALEGVDGSDALVHALAMHELYYLIFLSVGLYLVYAVASLPVRLAMAVRRLHDVGHSGVWMIALYAWCYLLAPLGLYGAQMIGVSPSLQTVVAIAIGGISLTIVALAIVFWSRCGQTEANEWGFNPKLLPSGSPIAE